MSTRTINLLHIEDDVFQQKVIAHHLRQIPELSFAITHAQSEDEAVAEFLRSPKDFVIIDYHLSQGDGLSCLCTLRRQDPIVPIVAVSGQATAEIAAALLRSGADDYISKQDLHSDLLVRSIRMALKRADAWRRHEVIKSDRARAALLEACKAFAVAVGSDFIRRLDDFEAAARKRNLSIKELPSLFDSVCAEMVEANASSRGTFQLFLRPVLLELQFRLTSPSEAV